MPSGSTTGIMVVISKTCGVERHSIGEARNYDKGILAPKHYPAAELDLHQENTTILKADDSRTWPVSLTSLHEGLISGYQGLRKKVLKIIHQATDKDNHHQMIIPCHSHFA